MKMLIMVAATALAVAINVSTIAAAQKPVNQAEAITATFTVPSTPPRAW